MLSRWGGVLLIDFCVLQQSCQYPPLILDCFLLTSTLPQADLLSDLRSLPRNSTVRKLNELIKRSRMLKVHVHLCSHLQSQFGTFGKAKTQQKLLDNMLDNFKAVQTATAMPMGDFPHLGNFRETIGRSDMSKFPSLDKKPVKKLMDELNQVCVHEAHFRIFQR